MRKLLFPLLTLFSGALCVSCFSTAKEETYPQAAITSFTLGYFNVSTPDVNYHGNDTTVMVREGGVMYPMTIDQTNNMIYNRDSLAYGSQLNGVTCTVGSTGTVAYRYLDEPEQFFAYEPKDSIDFTRPLSFVVVSTDGSYSRTYGFKLNVRQVFPDSVIWRNCQVPELENPVMAVRSDSAYLIGMKSDAIYMSSCDIRKGEFSSPGQVSGMGGVPGAMMVAFGKLFVQSDGSLYESADGLNWSEACGGIAVLFASEQKQYNPELEVWAVGTDGMLMSSVDMHEWTARQTLQDNFPAMGGTVVSSALKTNPSITRYVLAGRSACDTPSVELWTRLSTEDGWTSVVPSSVCDQVLPAWEKSFMFPYDGSLFAIGDGLECMYQSMDNGITWYACNRYADEWSTFNRFMQLPVSLVGYRGRFAAATDSREGIWIADSNGHAYRGAIRRIDSLNSENRY